MQDWKSRICESTRANFYSLFLNFEHQLYLEALNVKKFRVAMTKLKVSSHRLEIDVGRWARDNRTPINERKCRYCDKLEDEFHVLLECTLYVDLRKQCIKKYFWNRPNMLKLKELMSVKNRNIKTTQKKKKTHTKKNNTELYIEKAFKIRYGQTNV